MLPLFHNSQESPLQVFIHFVEFSSPLPFLVANSHSLSTRTHPLVHCNLPLTHHHPQAAHNNGVPIIVAERRVNYPCRAVFFLILVALTVLSFGIIGSSILARFYGNQHTERMRFQCRLPYHSEDLNRQALLDFGATKDLDMDELRLASTLDWMSELQKQIGGQDSDSSASDTDSDWDSDETTGLLERFFTEQVDLDMGEHADDEGVTKIDVPDFKDGRTGRFLHDFSFNQSAIVDKSTGRCFIMPLDRETVVPPTSFIDMMRKMLKGDFNLDMDVIQKNMRVVLPALKDMDEVSPNIRMECGRPMRIYKLEKFVHGVFKRSAELASEAKFGAFMGRMVQYDLHNMNDVEKYEATEQQ